MHTDTSPFLRPACCLSETCRHGGELCLPDESHLVGRHLPEYSSFFCRFRVLLVFLLTCRLVCAAVAIGEVANFAAYAMAPAILVTPMGALSVVIR